MNKRIVRWLLIVFLCLLAAVLYAQSTIQSTAGGSKAYVLTVDGAIGPAARDYIIRGINRAYEENAELLVLRMNTPGGLDASMRDIIQEILGSHVPVATWVAPSGSRAASAGTYILYASHIAAMAPSTNLGAATPVQLGASNHQAGEPTTPIERALDALKDLSNKNDDQSSEQATNAKEKRENNPSSTDENRHAESTGDVSSKKVINDAVAYIKGLASRHGRNAEWAEQAVREAVSLTAQEALENNVIDVIAANLTELLSSINGSEVHMNEGKKLLQTTGLEIVEIQTDWRTDLLSIITNPTLAYILLMIGIYGLILEGYNPGTFIPGVIGGICLILALYAFQVLPVNYAGFLLIILGFALIATEIFVPSFGILGIGGIISLVFGSVILLDTDVPGYTVNRGLIAGVSFGSAIIFGAIIWLATRVLKKPKTGSLTMIGREAEAINDFIEGHGRVHVLGEDWSAQSTQPIVQGQKVRVTAMGSEELVLMVEPLTQTTCGNT